MAVKGKGKQVAANPPRDSDASGSGKRRKGPGDAGPSSSSAAAKRRRRPGVIQFFDDAACVADEYEEEEEPESEDDLDDVFFTEEKTETANLKRTERSHPLPFLGKVKEEELSGDELEEFVKDRYANRIRYAAYGGSTKECDGDFTMDGALKEPTIWRVKCMACRATCDALSICPLYYVVWGNIRHAEDFATFMQANLVLLLHLKFLPCYPVVQNHLKSLHVPGCA